MSTDTRTPAQILDAYFEDNARRARELLALEADLVVAEAFDRARSRKGWDVGVGRRRSKIRRLEDRIAELDGNTAPDADDLVKSDAGLAAYHAAWKRRQIDARRAVESLHERPTAGRRATVEAWEDTADALDLFLDA